MITVTAEDIAQSRTRVTQCPMAIAVGRALGYRVGIGGYGVCLSYGAEGPHRHVPLPEIAHHFIAAYDRGQPVAPLTFEVDLP